MNKKKSIALALSIGVHILILLIGSTFFAKAFSDESAENNIISLNLTSNIIPSPKDIKGKDIEKSSQICEADKNDLKDQTSHNTADELKEEISKEYEHKTTSTTKKKENNDASDGSGLTHNSPTEQKSDMRNKNTDNNIEDLRTLDKRAIYNTQNKISDSGAVLELKGWIWDTTPNPDDDTDEVGKIVFEIEIDAMGEVVSITTLNRNVSHRVVSIYRSSLENITFSRTSDNQDTNNESNSKGKVTFYLKYK